MKNPLYNKYALEYARVIKDNAFNANFERPSFKALLPALKRKSILDLGCGPGELFEFFLKEKCSSITAVDLSQAMVGIVKERYGPYVNAYRQNLNMGLPGEKDAAFDLVVSSLAVH
ncbi:MAG: class I SAM-dependent methyltransferase [Desulfobacteraceae bacterium]|jgi:2-polyprenyl-3-methyl-5-hydroxy-6-metoxy-1,4-benzoquinol methylase